MIIAVLMYALIKQVIATKQSGSGVGSKMTGKKY